MGVLHISANRDCLGQVLSFIDEALEAADCPMKAQMQIDLAVEELFVNIADYAYTSGKGDAEIGIEIYGEPKTVEIVFSDRGIPYDPVKKVDPDTSLPAEERQIGGLGIFLAKKSMDDIFYTRSDGKNILTIRKILK